MGLREAGSVVGWKKTWERKMCLSEILHQLQARAAASKKPCSGFLREGSNGGALSADAEKEARAVLGDPASDI